MGSLPNNNLCRDVEIVIYNSTALGIVGNTIHWKGNVFNNGMGQVIIQTLTQDQV